MTRREFRNALNILRSIDKSELVDAGAISEADTKRWERFRDDPAGFLVKADDATGDAIWRIVEARSERRTAA